jgi:hypothetical protein
VVRGAWRRGLVPQVVDQLLGRHGLVGVQQQGRQQRPLHRRADRHRSAVGPHLQGSEHPKLHRASTSTWVAVCREQAASGPRAGPLTLRPPGRPDDLAAVSNWAVLFPSGPPQKGDEAAM